MGRARRCARRLLCALPAPTVAVLVDSTFCPHCGVFPRLARRYFPIRLRAADSVLYDSGGHGRGAAQSTTLCLGVSACGAFFRSRAGADHFATIRTVPSECAVGGGSVRSVSPHQPAHFTGGLFILGGVGVFLVSGHRRSEERRVGEER